MLKQKIFTIIFPFLFIFFTFATTLTANAAFSPSFELYSEGVFMVNLDTDIVVVSKNPDKKLYPASTTKIMTCLVALEKVKDFNAKVECPYECFDEFAGSNPNYYGASTAAIEPMQNNLTYMNCLYALMLSSGCEAANILAYNIAGSLDGFIDMMNETAAKLGCKNTHFSNAHGLFDEDNYTTAYDLYLITRYAIDKYPGFMKICSTYEYDMPANENNPEGYTITHTNRMMASSSDYYYEGVEGIKTGSIDEYYLYKDGQWDTENPIAGSRSLVTTAQKGGYSYLIISLSAPFEYTESGDNCSFLDHIHLYDWAFDEFEYSQIIGKNQQIMQADVIKGLDADKVGIVTTEDFSTLMPKSIDKSSIQQIKPTVDPLTAPVEKGMSVGNLELRLNGETLTEIPLATEEDIELDIVAEYREKIMNFITSPVVIAGGIALAALIIALIILRTVAKRRKQKAAEMQRRRKIQMAPSSKKNNRPRR